MNLFYGWLLWGAIIFLLYKIYSLNKRIIALEEKNKSYETSAKLVATTTLKKVPPTKSTVIVESEIQERKKRVEAEKAKNTQAITSVIQKPTINKIPQVQVAEQKDFVGIFLSWFKKDWMLKTGALFILAGMGWFFSYAFKVGWIDQNGRIVLGYAFGIAMMVFGWIKMHKTDFVTKAAVFFVLGATIILLTTFTARSLYGMFNPPIALLIMFATSMFVSFSGIRFLPHLGIAGLLLAGIAPLLTHSSGGDYIFLFAYLLVVVLGSHIVVHMTGQRESIFAGLVMVSLYSAPYILYYAFGDTSLGIQGADKGILLLFAYAFTSIFFLASIIGILRSHAMEEFKATLSDLLTACGTGLFLLVWVLSVASLEWQSFILLAWAIVFSVGAFLIFKHTEKREPFYAYSLVAVVLLGSATSLVLHGNTLTVAFTLEAAAIVLGIHFLIQNGRVTKVSSLVFLFPAMLALSGMSDHHTYFDSWSIAIHFLILVLYGIAGIMYITVMKTSEKSFSFFDNYSIAASIFLTIATGTILDNSNLIVAYSVQSLVIVLATHYLRKTDSSLKKMSVFLILPFYTILVYLGKSHELFDAWSLSALFFSAILFGLALIFFFEEKNKVQDYFSFFNLYALASALTLACVTWADLSGSNQIIAYSFEALLILLITHFMVRSNQATKIMSFVFGVPVLLSLPLLMESSKVFMDKESIALLILSLALLLISFLVFMKEQTKEVKDYKLFTVYLSVGSLYFWIIVWRSIHALFSYSMGTVVSLIVFTLSGLAIYGAGVFHESKGTKLYGSILAGFVIVHLLLVDVWGMLLVGKVITFLVVGALLMATAFIRKKV